MIQHVKVNAFFLLISHLLVTNYHFCIINPLMNSTKISHVKKFINKCYVTSLIYFNGYIDRQIFRYSLKGRWIDKYIDR